MSNHLQTAVFQVNGMHCAGCASAIEACLARQPEAHQWSIDTVQRQLQMSWASGQTGLEQIKQALQQLGYEISPLSSKVYAIKPQQEISGLPKKLATSPEPDGDKVIAHRALQRMLIALLCMMQVMMLSVPVYLAHADEITPDIQSLLSWAQALLTIPVVSFCAWPIYESAWRHLRHGQGRHKIGMDLPIALGLLIAFAASALATLRGQGEIYFDSVTMFCALLLFSRWLQERGLGRARAYLHQLAQTQMPLSNQLQLYPNSMETVSVESAQLKPGDLIWVRPGETFPVDGVVVQGQSAVSEALISGESTPLNKGIDDQVFASAVNLEQGLVVRVEQVGTQTVFSAIAALAEQASRSRPRLVQHADQAAQSFLQLILVLVIVAGAAWWLIDPARVVPVIVSILIVTCPCALSLAVPVALTAAQASLARHGVLVTRSAAIETLGHTDVVVFDKTGTLTEGLMQVERVHMLRELDPALAIRQAAALEQASNHPIARALRAKLEASSGYQTLPADEISAVKLETGAGVEGRTAQGRIRFGQLEYALALIPADLREAAGERLRQLMRPIEDTATLSVLVDQDGPIALFIFADRLRQDADGLMKQLRQRALQLRMLSGDRPSVVQALARTLGLTDAMASLKPEQKREQVRADQDRGLVVAMIGDGINDAPVIAQADVSMAFASASTLAQTQADFILLSNRLNEIETTFRIAAKTTAIIRQNLTWALAYNLIAIPVAASGHLAPLWAGIGMVASSLLVLANALRLLPRSQSGGLNAFHRTAVATADA